MERRKRLKALKNSFVDVKSTPKPECSTESYISLLPNEILLQVCQYLSPVDIVALSDVDQRAHELTCCMKEVNFSSCHKASLQQISPYMSRLTVQNIRKLNFNCNIFLKPYEIVKFICRCKNLTWLSIVQCGLKNYHFKKILESCTNLEEVSWSVGTCEDMTLTVSCPKMRSVCLFYATVKILPHEIDLFMLNFPNVEYLFLNFSSSTLVLFPFHGSWKLIPNTFMCSKRCMVTSDFVLRNDIYLNICKNYPGLRFSDNKEGDSDKNREQSKVPSKNRIYSHPLYLQIQPNEEDISLLSSGCCSDYSALALLVNKHVSNYSESIVKSLEVLGDKLKILTVQTKAQPFHPIEPCEGESICEIIEGLALHCKNITVINIPTLHFHTCTGRLVKAIAELKNLKTLNIPSCSFPNIYLDNPKTKRDNVCNLAEVVSGCKNVESFTLVGCCNDCRFVSDSQMYTVKGWKKLKHLTFYNIVFRTCNFLKHVATSCKEMKSLSFISTGSQNIPVNDLISFLKAAKNLSFLRINMPCFNPMFERFWDSVGEAVNLEGICIATETKVWVNTTKAMKALKKLKYLHLFHFHHRCVSDSFYERVVRSMKMHGISNVKMESKCILLENMNDHYSCNHLHLEMLDMFSF